MELPLHARLDFCRARAILSRKANQRIMELPLHAHLDFCRFANRGKTCRISLLGAINPRLSPMMGQRWGRDGAEIGQSFSFLANHSLEGYHATHGQID